MNSRDRRRSVTIARDRAYRAQLIETGLLRPAPPPPPVLRLDASGREWAVMRMRGLTPEERQREHFLGLCPVGEMDNELC